ncbi:MAG: beta-lactamase family protein [Lachnospiraceae bacterium]|nr:beta-lactamase family protein [Lachnospiraceae bacterium]
MADLDNLTKTFADFLSKRGISLHSTLLMRGTDIVNEHYYNGHSADEVHRMYSIAKSLVSVAIGILIDEGRLRLDDRIVSYFPEYVPENVSPWISAMTIYDMLTMRTCHKKTTYKADLSKNWVASFFTTAPDHAPNTEFNYDTSSAHVLGALVEKITGEDLFAFLRDKLSPLRFSEGAHLLRDPFGVSDGGSGLMCTSRDLAEFARLIISGGNIGGRQIISKNYLNAAFTNYSDISNSTITAGRCTGYGFMFWLSEKNTPVCFGMDGQFIIFCPEKNMTFITTADCRDKLGPSVIIDTFYDMLYKMF